MSKITGFVVTFAEWAAMGMPRRDPAWVREMFYAHCAQCPEYRPDGRTPFGSEGTCRICGCHVSPESDTLLNKLVLPNTECPADPPKWVRAVEEAPENPA